MPEFVLGLLLVVLLATNVWHVFPAVTRIRPGDPPWSDLDGLMLPVLTLTLVVVPYVSRVMRASMIEVLESDYVEMARLKGLPERAVLWRHALPNAVGPTLQVIAFNIAYLAGGVILIEVDLQLPRHRRRAARRGQRPQRARSCSSSPSSSPAIWVVVNLLADVGTVLVTPRLRTQLRMSDAAIALTEPEVEVIDVSAVRQAPRACSARRSRLWRTRIGLALVAVVVGIAIIGPWVAPHGPTEFVGTPNTRNVDGILFGTDALGQDVWSRFLHGGRTILVLAVVSTVIGLVVGVVDRPRRRLQPRPSRQRPDAVRRHHPRLPRTAAAARRHHHPRAASRG